MMVSSTTRAQKPYKYPILIGCAGLLLACFILMPEYDALRDEVGYMLRVTARIAFALLMLAYIARPLRILFGKVDPLRAFVRALLAH